MNSAKETTISQNLSETNKLKNPLTQNAFETQKIDEKIDFYQISNNFNKIINNSETNEQLKIQIKSEFFDSIKEEPLNPSEGNAFGEFWDKNRQ